MDRQATAEDAIAAQAAAAEAKQAAAQAQELFRRLRPLERYQALVSGDFSPTVVVAALVNARAAAAAATASTASTGSTASANVASSSTAAAAAPPINHTPPAVCVICMEACAPLVSMCPGGHSHETPHTVCIGCVQGVLKANSDD